MIFSPEELARYNRQIKMQEFGFPAQQKLKAARVLVVGVGGLGCPALFYLAAAGVGTIGMVDFDTVEESNLQRQVLFDSTDMGKPKVMAAQQKLEKLNPYIQIIAHHVQMTADNACDIIRDYDVVVDGTDNFLTRYLVNDACVILKKPEVFAAISGFEGQVAVFNLKDADGNFGPNYRDIFPEPPSPGMIPNCTDGGVLGVLPGMMGTVQAGEVIKIITGIGTPMSGQLWILDVLSFETRKIKIKRRENAPPITSLTTDKPMGTTDSPTKKIREISAEALIKWQNTDEPIQLIDVREPDEYDEIHLDACLIPLNDISERKNEIDRNKKVIIICENGFRSAMAILELQENFGFDNLWHLRGGILAYQQYIQTHD